MTTLRSLAAAFAVMAISFSMIACQTDHKHADGKPAYTADSCCAKAQTAGKACDHPCCVEAAKAGGVCKKCNKA